MTLAQAGGIVQGGLDTAAGQAGYCDGGVCTGAPPIPLLVAAAINVILGLVGVIFVILLIYSGILYLTSQGDVDRVKVAKQNITNAVIGIVIIVAAYAIAQFVVGALIDVSSVSGSVPG